MTCKRAEEELKDTKRGNQNPSIKENILIYVQGKSCL